MRGGAQGLLCCGVITREMGCEKMLKDRVDIDHDDILGIVHWICIINDCLQELFRGHGRIINIVRVLTKSEKKSLGDYCYFTRWN